jgi:hypothetical protein
MNDECPDSMKRNSEKKFLKRNLVHWRNHVIILLRAEKVA